MTVSPNFSREELYDLVWSKPLSAVASVCNISVPVLRLVCLEQDIPLPWGGYSPSNLTVERDLLPEHAGFEFLSAVAAAINGLHFPGESTASFKVAAKLSDPDPLIVAANRTVKHDFQFHGMPHMLRAGFGELAIRSSKSNWDRALRIMDTLVKVWHNRGYRIVREDKETKIYLRDVGLVIGLRETTTVEPPKEKYGSQTHTATGLLAFKVNGWLGREWKDGKVPLETHIKEILDHMEVAARDLEKSRAESEIQQQQRAQERQIEMQRIQADAEETSAFEALLQEAQRWHQLQILDKYLDALRQEVPRSPAFEQWLQWARNRCRIFDPITERQTKF